MRHSNYIGSILLAVLIAFTGFAQPNRASASSASSELPFDDIAANYATEAILHLSRLNIISGTGQRKFEPRKAITRAEFVAMLSRLLSLAPVSSAIAGFEDVPKTAWYYGWVQTGIQLGFVQGGSATRFAPAQEVSRQEAAALLARALNQTEASSSDGTDFYTKTFADGQQISSWAVPFVSRLVQIEFMKGDEHGNFRPQSAITRQEAAVLLDRVLQREQWADQIARQPDESVQLGWQYGQTTKQFEQQVASSAVNTLSPRWFFLGKSGGLDDYTDPSLLTWAHQRGKKVWAMVGNRSDMANTHLMLSASSTRAQFIAKLSDAVKRYGMDGMNIDFENVDPQDRETLTLFIKELSASLSKLKAVLSVNVSPDLGTDWTEAFDYSALGRSADYLVLMGYDEHWSGAPEAGSVSSLPWLESGLRKLLSRIPASKTILALPFYTRDWITNVKGVHSSDWSLIDQNGLLQANRLKPVWNETLGQYTAEYRQNGAQHSLWIEDGRSLTRKIKLGEAHSIAGYGYWYMGGESADMWTSVRNAMRFADYRFQ